VKTKAKTYYIKGGLYSVDMIRAMAIASHLQLLSPLELKRYLDGDKTDAYNILIDLIEANAESYRANRK
jgi:hypothetical protein